MFELPDERPTPPHGSTFERILRPVDSLPLWLKYDDDPLRLVDELLELLDELLDERTVRVGVEVEVVPRLVDELLPLFIVPRLIDEPP